MATFYRFDGNIRSAPGWVLSGVSVYVCSQPVTSTAIPPAPLATIYSDNAGANPVTQPLQTDGNGNFFFYAATGTYTLVYFDSLNRIPENVYPDQQVVTQGGGSVSSVAMTGDGVIFNTVVSGSPITSSGTLAPSLISQNAHAVLSGPSSGSAAAPTWRALVAGDIPALAYVTSVAATLTGSSLLSFGVSGSPITSSGTLAFTINFANQNANTVIAGPSSGGSGAVTARALVGADIFGLNALASSATPTFDLSTFPWPTFTMTINAPVTNITVSNGVPGQHFTVKWIQGAAGGNTVSYPAAFTSWTDVETTANAVTVQDFVFISSSDIRGTSPGLTNAT